ncbi:MAG TPA: phosphatase PAP2 family protein [Polyangiaceae bacterium]|nr:phosphatase PAP2 family protein [Polyangiaceae bacterium]
MNHLARLILLGSTLTATANAQGTQRQPVFELDPIADSVFLGGTLLVAATSEAIIGTGEIEAQLPDDEAELLKIDRWAAEKDSAALKGAQASDTGVLVIASWAIVDTTLAGFKQRPDSALTYGTLYLESAITTWCISNLFKMAVRRPRPRAYIELREKGSVSDETQEALSFYSLHTAMAASVASTATYLAWTRPGPAWEKWLVLGGAVTATSVVGVGRMLSAAHFTTDVIAGLGAGVAIGTLVPHVHRIAPVTISSTVDSHGGTVGVQGEF